MLDLTDVLRRMGGEQTNYPFRPVRCTEEEMQSKLPINGFVYFTTDTHKIYCGSDEGYIPMGGTTGIYYGQREFTDDEKFGSETDFIFDASQIESSSMPILNDLILNIPDGGFYRVIGNNISNIIARRLAIAGGGGGGTGGNTPGTTLPSFSLIISGGSAKGYSTKATAMPITLMGSYLGTEPNLISEISFSFVKNGVAEEPFYVHSAELAFNVEHTLDLIKFKHLFNETKKTVRVRMHDIYGQQKNTDISVQLISILLTKTQQDLLVSREDEFQYACDIGGATSGISQKYIEYKLYAEDNLIRPVLDEKTTNDDCGLSSTGTIYHKFKMNEIPHGVYVLTVQAFVEISGTTTLISSDMLEHKIAKFDIANNTPLLLVSLPEITEQYTNIPLNYMLVTTEGSDNYTLNIKLNGENVRDLNIISNTLPDEPYNLYFESTGIYTLDLNVVQLNKPYTHMLDIKPYTGVLPTINPNRSDLMLYLTARNKSNVATDRDEWKDYNGKHTAKLTGLHYSNFDGWLKNENNVNYLKLASGAGLSMPTFEPFKVDPTSSSQNGMTIELDFEFNGILDYDTELIKCVSHTLDGAIAVGFSITGDTARFYDSSAGVKKEHLISLNLVEGKRVRLSYVIEPNNGTIAYPMIYAYVNGKLSAAAIYKGSFISSLGFPATLNISSEAAQVNIYSIRFYSTALNNQMILNNYTASLDLLEEREQAYNSNNVYGANNKINYTLVSAENYDLKIPYMLLTGGYANEELDKWKRRSASDADQEARLPTGKKDYRMVDVEVHYPTAEQNDMFAGYKDYSFKNEFEGGLTMAKAYGKKPINGGAIMYAQGTSSMEYPVKNLRLRFNKVKKIVDGEEIKSKENFFTVKPEIGPVEIICMKADYMESSGSHNTGAGNFIDNLYSASKMYTPGQEHFDPTHENKNIVTCIKGHPCLIFYSKTGEEGSYEYVGKYNLNLDKATPEPFGFDHDDKEFGYLKPGDEYYEIDYDDDDKYIDTKEGEERKVVAEGELVNSIHCFEFLDNAVEVCNFMGKQQLAEVPGLTEEQFDNNRYYDYYIGTEQEDGSMKYTLAEPPFDPNVTYYLNTPMDYKDTWYGTFTNKDKEEVPGWTLGFESRYPEDKIGYHDADMLYPLASWLNKLWSIKTGKNGLEPDAKLANARFKNEYQCYLDKEFTLTYYLITEALLMADSRVKNMMIATWGKENYDMNKNTHAYYTKYVLNAKGDTYIPDETSEKVMTNNYIFYPIFYDMDTMLGLDNTGVYRFKYYDEDTNSSVYNGYDILWDFVRDNLYDDLQKQFTVLESANLTEDNILPFFNEGQALLANEAFYNGDTEYKYITPTRNGYYDHLNKKQIAPGVGLYLYAAQGDRALTREWFLNNRMNFLRGKYASNKFTSGDRVVYRQYYPDIKNPGDDFKGHEASLEAVPPSGFFEFTSARTGYAGIQLGANSPDINIKRFDGEKTDDVFVPNMNLANGTEAYLLGLSNLADLGDLSDKYMQKFVLESSNPIRLQYLRLGNPHKDYYNPYWGTKVGGKGPEIGITSAKYLEEFYFENCSTYTGNLDFSGCPAINTIRLTGSSVSTIQLPPSGVIRELRLPSTLTKLELDAQTLLTDENFSFGGYNYGSGVRINEPGKGGSYTTDYSSLTELTIIDTPINGYNIVKNALSLDTYFFKNINWEITEIDEQYCLRDGQPGDINDIYSTYYYYDQGSKEFKLYNSNIYPSAGNGKLYEKVTMIDAENNIIYIPVLESLLTKRTRDNVSHAEALSGTITINIPSININEYAIYSRYIDLFPNLVIKFEGNNIIRANAVEFYNIDINDIGDADIQDFTPSFTVKTTSGSSQTLKDFIVNQNFIKPYKSSTTTKTYAFTGVWQDYISGQKYYHEDYLLGDEYKNGALSSDYCPGEDMKLFPLFKEETRLYTINFYNTSKEDKVMTLQGEYERTIASLLIADSMEETQSKYCYKADGATFSEHQRYAFKGWQAENSFNNNEINPSLYSLNTVQIYSDMNLFAYYEVEDAREKATNIEYFKIDDKGAIYLKNDAYKTLLAGKITLPAYYNNTLITGIGSKGFEYANNITKVYFLSANSPADEDIKYTTIGENAFYLCENLTEILLPPSTRKIGDQAFYNCFKLKKVHLNDNITHIGQMAFMGSAAKDMVVEINKLPDSLTELGFQAFNYGGEGIKISKLPTGIEILPTFVFNRCPNIAIVKLGLDDNNNPTSLTTISSNALANCSNSTVTNDITIGGNVRIIGQNAFQSYAANNNHFNFYHTLDTTPENNYYDVFYDANEPNKVSSPDGSGIYDEGYDVVSMGCGGTWTYMNNQAQIYAEVL